MSATSAARSRVQAQTLAEFAFVIPAFLLMVMGIVDLGRGIFAYNMLSNLAREGARVAIIQSNVASGPGAICTQVLAEAQIPNLGSTSCSSMSWNTSWTDGALTIVAHQGTAGSATDPARVTLNYSFTPITPFIDQAANIATGRSFQISASSSMYVEN